jgi:hypothetical protein
VDTGIWNTKEYLKIFLCVEIGRPTDPTNETKETVRKEQWKIISITEGSESKYEGTEHSVSEVNTEEMVQGSTISMTKERSTLCHPRTTEASRDFYHPDEFFFKSWKQFFLKLQKHCSKFHERLIHLNTKHGVLYLNDFVFKWVLCTAPTVKYRTLNFFQISWNLWSLRRPWVVCPFN